MGKGAFAKRLAAGAILLASGAACAAAAPFVLPRGAAEPEAQAMLIEGVVTRDGFDIDQREGTFPPYVDFYEIFVVQGCRSHRIVFDDVSWLGEGPWFSRVAEEVEPGEAVRVVARPVPGREGEFEGISLEALGEAELPAACVVSGAVVDIASLDDLAMVGDYNTFGDRAPWLMYPHRDWYRVQDAWLVQQMSSRTFDGVPYADSAALAGALSERLPAEDISALGHADLIRLAMLDGYLGSAENRAALGRALDADVADIMTEHGGIARLSEGELILEERPSLCGEGSEGGPCADDRYVFDAMQGKMLDTLSLYHQHALTSGDNPTGPSWDPSTGEGDLSLVHTDRMAGYLFAALSGDRFNALFYTKSADGSDAVIIDLGVYDYGG